ncbi:membrane-associated protein Hem-like isoform X2 [Ruditapes philippinarum]|uniref:membrane-associated protein Hem-like isoform X2 n=1 Tax=Ruditapes philippinarum TaxID=129788 RepID=UPI00295AE1AF|nr:membrane-associated protein Hem-like isoform X2 [Ruditapes philippinarum]
MSRSMIPSQQKLAEKLTILNDRGQGMLTRIYNIKKMLGTSDNKPAFLSDKQLEPALRYLLRKFPQIDSKASALVPVNNIKSEVVKSLSLYYYTFVDIMDFKDHVADLLTTIDACQVFLDITLNFDLAKSYLDLVTTYVSIMILVSKVDDRKTVLALYNVAHEYLHQSGDPSFPRLGQMVIEYEVPMKKMSEEFVPHSRVLIPAILSLHDIYSKKTLTADQLRAMQVLSLLAEPQKISQVPTTTTIQCEYLSQDILERWIIFGLMLCHQYLQDSKAWDLWKTALQSGYIVQLCRDEILHIHSYIVSFFDSLKGQNMNKRVNEVKELQHQALQTSPGLHRERRKFLRTALRELTLIYTDQPGLLGPKALYVLQALSMAQNEVHWLLRHFQNPPGRRHNVKMNQEDFVDRQIPELLFHIEELKGLVKKYHQVMQRYYVQYLAGYDAVLLNQLIQNLNMCPEDESVILSSISTSIAALTVKQVEDNEMFDFRGLRLDWFRLQAYTSVSKAGLILKDHHDLAKHLNTIVFHTKMVDYLDEVLNEASDLSIYCFYTTIFEHQFKQCMEFPAQHRYCIVFPMICGHFMNATHSLCPEERHSIGTTSVQYAHWFLKDMADEVNQVITAICEEQCLLNYKLLPKHSVQLSQKKKPGKEKKKDKDKDKEPEKPGQESARKNRENFTRMDKLHMALTELCYAINHSSVIQVWEHGFVPREFFHQQLETRFNKMYTFRDVFKDKALVGMMMYNPETNEIAKPSELLCSVKAIMSVLQSIENYVHIDIARVFNNVLPQQTQPLDSFSGEKTITANYTNWYLEVFLRRVTCNTGQIVYSPSQKAFVSLSQDGQQIPFAAEEYADLSELKALAELIGPYGMKYMGEKLMFHVANQVDELKKLVVANKEVLAQLRTSFDKPELMRELFRKLVNVDSVLLRMTIVGVLLSFRSLAQEALNDVLEDRVPFLVASIRDIHHYVPKSKDSMHSTLRSKMVSELASSAGVPSSIDPVLVQVLRQQKHDHADSEYEIACLLMVFVAVSIPKLARIEQKSIFVASVEGHLNNSHCLAKAINQLAGALFYLHGPSDTEQRLQEFLALASSSLLRLGQESEKEAVKNRESVYLLLDKIVQESPFLTMDLLESCFPYALLRNAYHSVYKHAAET